MRGARVAAARDRRPASGRDRDRRRASSCAARTGRSARSPTPAGTAGTSCCRAARRRTRRPSSARTTRGRTRCPASCAARPGTAASASTRRLVAAELPAVEWHGLVFVDGSGGAAGPLPLAGARRDRRAVRAVAAGDGGHAQLRRGGELEDPHRELPRVLSLPDDPPGAVQRVARRTAGRTTRPPGPGSAAGCRCATAPRRCRSTGTAAACRCAGCRMRAADGDLRGHLPERAAQPAPGLRDDARPRADGRRPDADRVLVGVRARGGLALPASTPPTRWTSGT